MIKTIIEAILGTPWWAWAGLAYLLFIGIRALKPSIKPIPMILILPTIFLILSLQGLFRNFTIINVTIWISAVLIGAAFSFFLHKNISIQADRAHHLIALPGTITTLFIVLFIFCVKYYFGYQMAINPSRIQEFSFNLGRLGIFAFITGISIGKFSVLLYKYFTISSTNLKRTDG